MKKILLLLCLLTVTLQAQVRRDSAARIRFGDTLPATCNKDIGQVFFLIEPGSPVGLYQCLATDTWSTSMGTVTGTGASDQVAVFSSASEIGGSANLTFDGTNFDVAVGLSGFGSAVTTAIDAIDLSTAIRTTDGNNDSNAILFTVQTFGEGSLTERDWKMYGDITTNRLSVDFQTNSGGYANLFGMGTLGQVFLGAGVPAGASRVALRLDQSALTGDGNENSNILELRGASFETATPHTIDWRQQVDLLDNLGDSQYIWSSGIDLAFTTRMTLSDSAELGLPLDTASIQLGASQDVQMHRGDGADILEQRRGTNPQEWRLYERFVSHSDYDRLTFYIGGGPPLLTAEIEAQSTVAGQGINLLLEAQDSANGGSVTLQSGSNRLVLGGSSSSTTVQMFPDNSLTLNGFRNAFFGGRIELGEFESSIVTAIDIDIDPGAIVGMGTVDSHSINIIGRADDGSEHTAEWKTFVDVTSTTGESIFTIQERIDAAAFVNAFEITNTTGSGGKVTFPQVGEHSIGTALDDANQLTLGGDYFALDTGGTVSKFMIENRLTAPTGTTTGLFLMNIDGTLRTQTATESIADVAVLNLERPVITDNLTGGGVITEASILRIENDPVEGASNFSILVEGGLSEFRGNLQMGDSDRAAIVNENPSTTNPVLLPDQTNLTSGIGGINGDVSFIANGTNLITGNATGLGFFGVTPAVQPAAYTRNATVVEDRTLLASASATVTNNNNVLAALIADLQSLGLIQ